MNRYELTDEQWEQIKHIFPARRINNGRLPHEPRQVLNAIFWVLRSGAPWRDLPERYGPWQTMYHRFNAWRKDGSFDKLLETLQIRLDREGHIDWDLWCIDGSSVRASRAAAGAGQKGGSMNHRTTHWVARAADGEASSTWLLTATAFPLQSASPRANATSRKRLRKS